MRRGRLIKAALGIGLAVLVLLGAAADVWWRFERHRDQPGPLADTRDIVIPHGGLDQVAAELTMAGVIVDPRYFRLAAWISRGDGPLRAAEFAIPAHASIRQILTILRTAKPVTHHVTIPEGLTAHQIASLFARAEASNGNVDLLEEGSLLPQTYAYDYGTARATIVARARAAMTHELAVVWAERGNILPLTSPRDALILASIVERETARPDERAHVASVYLNRLRHGMRLQADPTVVYAVTGGTGVLGHKLTRAELDRDDPFNTYRNAGLPPGPICNPGLASLRAVTHPAETDDLYFVADGSGGHVFAATREAHERNVARWREIASAKLPHGSPD